MLKEKKRLSVKCQIDQFQNHCDGQMCLSNLTCSRLTVIRVTMWNQKGFYTNVIFIHLHIYSIFLTLLSRAIYVYLMSTSVQLWVNGFTQVPNRGILLVLGFELEVQHAKVVFTTDMIHHNILFNMQNITKQQQKVPQKSLLAHNKPCDVETNKFVSKSK